jgi:hypothetical protein
MHFSILRSIIFLFFVGLVVSAPVSKRHFNVGQLSSSPPSQGFGIAQYGSFNDFSLQTSDVIILQFALMLEVCLGRRNSNK